MSFPTLNCRVDSLATSFDLPIDVLRLDLLHPVISGNKWFKLKEYLHIAKEEKKTTLLTFGGAYSNHIVATAAAAQMAGLKSIGIIRGEEPGEWSPTLMAAKDYGMQLYFISRAAYQQKEVPTEIYRSLLPSETIVIPEGGYGRLGMIGARDILLSIEASSYTHIVSAVGTGTTLTGLVDAANPEQRVIGIPVLKNAHSLQREIADLLPAGKQTSFELQSDYHFGGYAKRTPALVDFMNAFYRRTCIPTDFVYTGKTFYAVLDLLKKGFFSKAAKILVVHTGGLQGNLSLPNGTLIFR
jgi:1-aminocyclopropane-1-carboxylate deaminase